MDIYGIGRAIVDMFCFLPENAEAVPLPAPLRAGGAVHLPSGEMDRLLLETEKAFPFFSSKSSGCSVSGGTAANILKAAAALGNDVFFTGSVGNGGHRDDCGLFFQKQLARAGVASRLASVPDATGRCLVVRTADGTAAIAASPAGACLISPGQIDGQMIKKSRLVVIEGMLLDNTAAFEKTARLCAECSVPLALDAGSVFAAELLAGAVLPLFRRQDIILFLNEDEASVFRRAAGNFPALTASGNGTRTYPVIVEKQGEKGASAWQSGAETRCAARADKAFAATGAGDTFAGAFLSAWLRGKSLADCLGFGNDAARLVLDVPGTGFKPERFAQLRSRMEQPASHGQQNVIP